MKTIIKFQSIEFSDPKGHEKPKRFINLYLLMFKHFQIQFHTTYKLIYP